MTDWAKQANCHGVKADVFYPETYRGGPSLDELSRGAQEICAGCVVRDECLEYALEAGERWGVWGGRTEKERRRILRDRKRAVAKREKPRAAEARMLRSQGRSVAEVAANLDVDVSTVKRWTAGREYERVTPQRGERPWCAHCDADRAWTSDGICRPCDEYRRKYDRLPDFGVLVKRWRIRDAHRAAS